MPYQFKLLQDVLVQVRKHGSSGKHLSGGERSMLSAFQEAAQKVKQRDENSFVPFHYFYDTVHTFLDGAIRRVIDRAESAAQAGNGLKKQDVDVLKLLFLIRYVDGIASNIENLSTLMISDIHADKITIRRALQESLDRLVHENYASRNGETYLFLTDDEQDINREIRNIIVDQSEVIHMIGQAVFADLYPGNKFRYKNRYDFPYDRMVDNAIVGQPSSDIKLRLITLASDMKENEADAQLILQSRAGNEAIVLLSTSCDYYQEFEEVRRIEKYIKQRNVSQLPEAIRKIIQGKQSEAKEREKFATNQLKEAIIKGMFYISGERVQIRCSSVKDVLDEALSRLVEDVYSKLSYVDSFVQSDQDIQKILAGNAIQETMAGIAVPNSMALEEIRQYLDIRSRQHMTVTMSEIQKRYQSVPYGWREIDIAAIVATLMRGQKIQLIYGGTALLPSERKVIECLRKRTETEKTVVRQKVSVTDAQMKKSRQLAAELFGAMDLRTDEENLCSQIETLLSDAKRKNEKLIMFYTASIPYPGKAVVDNGKATIDNILTKRSDNVAFLDAFTKAEDDLLDWSEDIREVEFFFNNQKKIFDSAWKLCDKVQREKHYFADEPEAVSAVNEIQTILKTAKPYRRIVELPTLQQKIDAAYDRINEARRNRVQEIIIQARGDIHTLAGDDPDLRNEIRKADEELERRRDEALAASSPTLLDASITQILTYKDSVCRKLEQLIANKATPVMPKLRVATLRRYDIMPQKRLSSEAEIEAYVDELRTKLMSALKDNDAIQLN